MVRARLLGLNKKQVDGYLKNISKGYDDRLSEVQQRINKCAEENILLNEKLKDSSIEKDKYEKKKAQIEQAEANIAKSVALIADSSGKELKELEATIEEKLAIYDERIALVKKETGNSRKQLDSLLESISNLLDEKHGLDEKQGIDERQGLDEKQGIDLQDEKAVNDTVALSTAAKVLAQPNTCRIIAYESKHASVDVKKQDSFWGSAEYKMTADGTKLDYSDGNEKITSIFKHSMKSVSIVRPLEDAEMDTNIFKQAPMEFWDSTPIEPVHKHIMDEVQQPSDDAQQPADEILQGAEAGALEEATAAAAAVPAAAAPAAAVPAAAASSSIEINALRTRYIAGKIAGETLYDKKGSIIITKNEVITQEVITRAEAEGSLSELIVNMILPGWNN